MVSVIIIGISLPAFEEKPYRKIEGLDPDLDMYSYISNYDIVSLLGRGAMGEVYEGRDPIMQRGLAIKTASPSLTEDPELIERFVLEARAAGSLSHPCIVTIHECGRKKEFSSSPWNYYWDMTCVS